MPKMTLVRIDTGSRIPPTERLLQISFLGHISAHDQDIFTKFGGYVDNWLPKCVEWSKCDSFENPVGGRWPCATHTTYRRSILTSSAVSHFFTLFAVTNTTIDNIFLVLISTGTHSLHLYSHFLPNFPSKTVFTEWQHTALCHLASLFCAICRPSV